MTDQPENTWERVTDETSRLKVDGGYIYRVENSKGLTICLVPDVDLKRYKAHLREAYNAGFKDGMEESKHPQEGEAVSQG